MADLERALRSVAVEWPETPDVAGRLELRPRPRRRTLVVAAVALAVALVAAFAVPQSRSAILRFFHLGGVTIERVDTLPPADERPLAAGLGAQVGESEAENVLGAPFRPADHGPLHLRDGVVSTLLPGPVLLSEFGNSFVLKKLVGAGLEFVQIAPGVEGIWLSGDEHVVVFPAARPRLAGHVLLWAVGNVTFRLEGPVLTKAQAVALARTIAGTGSG